MAFTNILLTLPSHIKNSENLDTFKALLIKYWDVIRRTKNSQKQKHFFHNEVLCLLKTLWK